MLLGDFNNSLPVPRLEGKNVSLVALDLNIHLDGLWDAQTKYKSESSSQEDLIFSYLMYGPFESAADFRKHIENVLARSQGTRFPFVIEYKGVDKVDGVKTNPIVGFVTYMDVVPAHRVCEIGSVWLDPRYRRRNIMDEAVYLLLRHAFEGAAYRRVEWRCNDDNESSKKMALRNQFQFEGVLRCHSISKGVNRNTTLFSIIDGEWDQVKTNFERRF